MRKLLIGCFLVAFMSPALASEEPYEEQKVTLSVPGMVCTACPVIITKGLEKVDGVVAVDVSYEEKLARVTYDASRVTISDLITATRNVGQVATVLNGVQ